MAAGAVKPKLAGMDGRFLVTTRTFWRYVSLAKALVALVTPQDKMSPLQGKHRSVVKIGHRILAIMARLASIAVQGQVIGDESRFGFLVAIQAIDPRSIKAPRQMTPITSHCETCIIGLVFSQAVAGQPIMLEGGQIIVGDFHFSAVMLCMAADALFCVWQPTVDALFIHPFQGYLFVALLAVLSADALPGHMAEFTLFLKLRVRLVAPQWLLLRVSRR